MCCGSCRKEDGLRLSVGVSRPVALSFCHDPTVLDDLGLKSLADLPPLSGDMPQSKEFELVFGDEPSEEKDKTAESAEGVADRPQERAETE